MCEPLRLHRRSNYLIGKDKEIAEIYVEHPSCSKQHAVILFRLVSKKKDDDTFSKKVTIIPYIIDLESTNGSYLNGKKLESSRYVELRPSDVLRFGESAREYVLLHEDITKTSLTQE
jgi:smad nuclear-interacting protein 1